MSQEPPKPLPQNVVQATGQVAETVVHGLSGQPLLLGIIVLNIIGISVAGYIGLKFLDIAREGSAANRQLLTDIMHENQSGLTRLLEICLNLPKNSLQTNGKEDRERGGGDPDLSFGGAR